MSFSEQPPSKQWAALTFKGEKIADVWFKPEGEPFALLFHIPQTSFQIPGMSQRLTAENLLRAVGIATVEVESWFHGDDSQSGMDGANPELRQPLPPPQDNDHLMIHVRMKQPAQADAPMESGEPAVALERAQDLVARWNAILGLEVTIDTLRQRMESLRMQMEGAANKALSPDEKVHAMNSDLAQWNKAKSRVHYVLPKAKEFIHRATWALATPERKKLEELLKNHMQSKTPIPEMEKVSEQLEFLLKDRQILSSHGTAVLQECQGVSADIQGSLRTLQSNAAANARRKAGETRVKSKKLRG